MAKGLHGTSLHLGISHAGMALIVSEASIAGEQTTYQVLADYSCHSSQIATLLNTLLTDYPCRGLPVHVTLSDEWGHLFMVTPPQNATRLSDLRAAAAMRFSSLYGNPDSADESDWVIEADWQSQHAFLACALPRFLLTALHQFALRYHTTLITIVPQSVLCLNQAGLRDPVGVWYGIMQEHSITIAMTTEQTPSAKTGGPGLIGIRSVPLPASMMTSDTTPSPPIPAWLEHHIHRSAWQLNVAPPDTLDFLPQRFGTGQGDHPHHPVTQSDASTVSTTSATSATSAISAIGQRDDTNANAGDNAHSANILNTDLAAQPSPALLLTLNARTGVIAHASSIQLDFAAHPWRDIPFQVVYYIAYNVMYKTRITPFHGIARLITMAGLLICLGAVISNIQQWHEAVGIESRIAQLAKSSTASVATQRTRQSGIPPGSISAAEATAVNTAITKLNLPWHDILEAVEQATPDTIALLSLEPDAQHNLMRINAEAKDSSAMLSYLRTLKNQELFQEQRGDVTLTMQKSLSDADKNNHNIHNGKNTEMPIRFRFEARWQELP